MRSEKPVTIDEVRKYYNEFNPHLLKDLEHKNSRLVEIKRFIKKNIARRGYTTALDVGCGIGITSEFLRKFDIAVTAIDLSDVNIMTAKTIHPGEVDYVQGDFTIAKLGYFDLVCAFDVVEHIRPEDLVQFTSNLYKHCAKIALVTIPRPDVAKKNQEIPEILQIVDEAVTEDAFDDLFNIVWKRMSDTYIYYILSPRR